MNEQDIAIIGAGNLGTSLAYRFAADGHRVNLGSRRPSKLTHQHQGKLRVCSYREAISKAEYILITVPDDAIESTCRELIDHLTSKPLVAHCSGSLSSKVLDSAKEYGCATASLHPLNTFPSPEAGLQTLLNDGHETALYWEGDNVARDSIVAVFESVGFKPRVIGTQNKNLYHAACVFACNLLTALIEVSLQTAESADIDKQEFWESVQPLIRSTLNNITEHGTTAALSGPIARGDVSTIDKQTELLDTLPIEIGITYKDLSRHALTLAIQRGQLSQATIKEISDLLN